MKKNKTIYIIIGLVLCLVVVGIILIATRDKDFSFTGTNNIVSSLESQNQGETDDLIKKDLEENKYRLSNAKVFINPYKTSPLTALITFMTDSEVSVEVTVKGKNGNDLVTNYEKAKEHYIPVYGLYEDYNNTVIVRLSNGESNSITIKTEHINSANITANVSIADREKLQVGDLYFFTSPLSMNSYAYDNYGDLRWITSDYYYHDLVPLENGHFLVGNETMNEKFLVTEILEMDYLGRIYNKYTIDEGYLNDIYVKEDGNFLLASGLKSRETYSDYIIEVDRKTGKIIKSWDIRSILEEIDPNFMSNKSADYFYNSGIEYIEETDTLLLTYWGGEFVINLSYKNSEIRWIFSNPDNFSSAFKTYLLKKNGEYDYPKGMHSATLDGKILKVFDNGWSTNEGEYNYSLLKGSYSSANTYEIIDRSIELKTSLDEGKKYFSYALGDYKTLSNNRELISFSRTLVDINDGDAINDHRNLKTVLVEKLDGNTVLEFSLDNASYKVSKVAMNASCGFSFDALHKYTSLTPTEGVVLTDAIKNKIKDAELRNYEFGYSNNIIESNVAYMLFEEAKLILIDDDMNGAMYTLKEKDAPTQRIIPDLDSGKYYIYVLENGTIYKTDNYIEIE